MALGLSHWYQDYFIRSWIIIFERVDRSSWSTFFDVPGTTWSTAIVTGQGAPERSRPRPTTPSAPLASPSTPASAEFVCSMVTSRTLLKRSNFLLKQKHFLVVGWILSNENEIETLFDQFLLLNETDQTPNVKLKYNFTFHSLCLRIWETQPHKSFHSNQLWSFQLPL